MHKNLRRSVVALATAFACLGIMASPASATTTPHTVTVTGGTITAIGTGTTPTTFTGSLGGTVGTGCSTTSTATVDNTASTIDITAYASVGHFVLNGVHYVATITRAGSTSGTYAPGTSTNPGTFGSLTLSLTVVIRAAANNTSTNFDCATTGTTLCTLRVTTVTAPLHFTGTYTGSAPSTGGNSTSFTSNSTTTPAAAISLGIGTCQVPFSTFNGGTASVAGLTGTF